MLTIVVGVEGTLGSFQTKVLARDFVRNSRYCVYEVTVVDISIVVDATSAVVLTCPQNAVVTGILSFTGREEKT